jgi:myxalamid-type polyketide synthase MxaE and MxaD
LAATWLIESDDESAATLLTGHLEAANQRCVSTRLDLESPSGVIIMRGLDAETLSIAQALLEQNHRPERGLWFVTRNGQCINSDTAPVPEQSAMWGFAKVLALEHPEVRCHRVDIDEVSDLDSQMARVAAEVLESGTPSEDQVAYRSDHRFVPRLKRATLPGRASLKLRGTYLITGGTGGLGLATARWLSERGVSRIVLTSRTGDSTDPIIDEIRGRGTHVDIVLGDISREEDVLRVLSQSGSLTGVIHAAGVLHDGAIVNQAWSTFQTVLDPKIRGAILLHRHTAGMPLQHFILFSSSSGLLGNRGQANHAAANMFLDQLARYRTSRGLPAVSIDWGPWSQTGAAARRGQVGTPGMNWIAPEQGLEALERILAANVAQVGVISVDWRAFAAQFANSQTSSFFNGMIPAVEGKSGSKREVPDTRVAELLESVTPSERRPLLTEYLAQQVMRVLRLDSRPAPDIGFFDIGMDSLMAVELRNRISSDLGLPRALPSTTLFDYPTVAALAAHLSPEPTAIGAPRNSDDVLGHLLEDVDDAGLDRFSQSDFDSLIESAYRTLGE